MPRTLFVDLAVSGGAKRATSLRALPFSLGVHALAIVAVASLAARPAASELHEEPPGTLIFPTTGIVPAHAEPVAPRNPAPQRPRHSGSGGPQAPIPTGEPEGVRPEPPGDAEEPHCLTNCGDGSGPGDATEGDASSGSGAPDGTGEDIGPRAVGGEIRPPIKVHDVLPVYPELARRARVQGSVVVQCVIDESGRVADAQVVKGHFLLDEAALSAVRQWRYEPTRLNGRAIAVFMTVTVNFVQR